jgi:hypothetical protein
MNYGNLGFSRKYFDFERSSGGKFPFVFSDGVQSLEAAF